MKENSLAKNKKWVTAAAIYGCVFALMLFCNRMSAYVVDDFQYMFSFYDNERIGSLYDIFMSMRVHRYLMNGRLAAHTLVQLFSMTPMWVFDIVNALMYVLQLFLLYRICRGDEERSNSVLLLMVCGAWIFCPSFGQVNLWQDGSFNYMWSCVFSLAYLHPIWEDYLRGKPLNTLFAKICFLGLAFFMGAYSETVSAAAIFMAMLLMLLMRILDKRKLRPIWWGGLVMAILGYLFIYTAPAQLREKGAEMKFSVLLQNFLYAATRYWQLVGFLLVLFVLLLAANWAYKTPKRRILLGLVFLAGSLAANFIMMFAQYYTDRSAVGAFLFLLGADGILLYPLIHRIPRKALAAILCLALLITLVYVYTGVQDIAITGRQVKANEAYILECKEAGIMDVQIPMVVAVTKYSQLYGLKYLDMEDVDTWPNDSMADYYGVNTVIGIARP